MLESIIVPTSASFLTGLITWLFARGKIKEQIRTLRIENQEKSAKYYQGLVDDLAKRLDKALEELHLLDIKYRELLRINQELIEELRKYKQLQKVES